ncbi:MAG: DUF4304 domain-containing protein [Candidatus Kapaibacterium sp.]
MEKFKRLISTIGTQLKAAGFTKQGNTFYLQRDSNWGIINFQKSMSSTKQAVKFTINLGVQSTSICKVLKYKEKVDKPTIGVCHWTERIGFLLPQKQDYWWTISDDTDLEELIVELSNVVGELAVPELEAHITDESLMILWLNGFAGCTMLGRYIYLTTLLKLHHDERLADVIDDLLQRSKGKSYEQRATAHIKQLELYGN